MNTYAVFRAVLPDLDGTVLALTAFSFYRLTVNGHFVSFGPARAGKGHARVDEIALSPYASEGENEILIEVAGYYCKTLSTVKQPSFLQAEVRRGETVLAATGHQFDCFLPPHKLQQTERYSKQRHFTEIWDLREAGTLTEEVYRTEAEILPLDLQYLPRRAPYPLYEDLNISASKLGGVLRFEETLPYKKEKYSRGYLPEDWGFWQYDALSYHPHTWIQRQEQTPTRKEETLPLSLQENEYAIFDLGHIEAGFFMTKLKAFAESEVIFAFTEYYEGETFRFSNMNAHNVISYLLSAGGEHEVMSFEPYTCRFLMVAVKKGAVKLEDIGMKSYMFDIRGLSYPDCKDKELQAIYRAAVRTFAHNAVDLYTDCPSRERAGWLCDSYFTAKTEFALTGKTAVEDAFLENYRYYRNEGEIREGALPMCYPADVETDEPEGRFIPQWTMWYILECAEYCLKRGHEDAKEDFRESIYMLLHFYRQFENENGLLEKLPSWNFVEWSVANDWTEDVNFPTNFLYAGVLDAIADLYDDTSCRRRAKEVRDATIQASFNGTYFHDHAVRDESGQLILQDHASEACQYYAILFGGLDMDSARY